MDAVPELVVTRLGQCHCSRTGRIPSLGRSSMTFPDAFRAHVMPHLATPVSVRHSTWQPSRACNFVYVLFTYMHQMPAVVSPTGLSV